MVLSLTSCNEFNMCVIDLICERKKKEEKQSIHRGYDPVLSHNIIQT